MHRPTQPPALVIEQTSEKTLVLFSLLCGVAVRKRKISLKKKYRFSNYTLLLRRKAVPRVVIIHIKTKISLKDAKLCSKGKNQEVHLCSSPEV